jgi:hypothetical protein
MIAAGIGDDATFLLVRRQRCDLVVSPPQLEGADGLLVLRLQVELATVSGGIDFMNV